MIALVVARYVRVALFGLAAAVAVSNVSLRLVSVYLVGVTTSDPLTFAAVGALVLTTVGLGAGLPARRIRVANFTRELARQ